MSLGGVGQGTTLSLSVNGVVARMRTLQMPEWVAEAVDFTSLDETDWMIFLPGSVKDPGAFTTEVFFTTDNASVTLNVPETATITFPIQVAGNSVNATLVGSGFTTSFGYPNAQSAEPMMSGLSFKYDGITPPSFTVEALSVNEATEEMARVQAAVQSQIEAAFKIHGEKIRERAKAHLAQAEARMAKANEVIAAVQQQAT